MLFGCGWVALLHRVEPSGAHMRHAALLFPPVQWFATAHHMTVSSHHTFPLAWPRTAWLDHSAPFLLRRHLWCDWELLYWWEVVPKILRRLRTSATHSRDQASSLSSACKARDASEPWTSALQNLNALNRRSSWKDMSIVRIHCCLGWGFILVISILTLMRTVQVQLLSTSRESPHLGRWLWWVGRGFCAESRTMPENLVPSCSLHLVHIVWLPIERAPSANRSLFYFVFGCIGISFKQWGEFFYIRYSNLAC